MGHHARLLIIDNKINYLLIIIVSVLCISHTFEKEHERPYPICLVINYIVMIQLYDQYMIINYSNPCTSIKKKLNDYQVTINRWHVFDESPVHNHISEYLIVVNSFQRLSSPSCVMTKPIVFIGHIIRNNKRQNC